MEPALDGVHARVGQPELTRRDPPALEERPPARGHLPVVLDESSLPQRSGQVHAETTGEVSVARPAVAHRPVPGPGAQDRRSGKARRGNAAKALDDAGDVVAGEPDIAVTSLPDVHHETTLDEQVDVLARGRPGEPRVPAELADGPGPPVHECCAHHRARGVGEHGCDTGDVRESLREHANRHASSVTRRLFGRHRTGAG